MKDFALIFRMNITDKETQPSEDQMKLYMQQWTQWINDISREGRLAEGGNHFSRSGRVLRSDDSVNEGPYVSDNISVAGYIIIKAKSLNDATGIAGRCPILNGKNTSVEIREVAIAGE